jgi:hypothetical protein
VIHGSKDGELVASVEGVILYSCITIISLVLFLVSFLSYRKYRKTKVLLISMMLLVFFARGVLLSLGLFYPQVEAFTSSVYIWAFDIVILVALYVTSLKK